MFRLMVEAAAMTEAAVEREEVMMEAAAEREAAMEKMKTTGAALKGAMAVVMTAEAPVETLGVVPVMALEAALEEALKVVTRILNLNLRLP